MVANPANGHHTDGQTRWQEGHAAAGVQKGHVPLAGTFISPDVSQPAHSTWAGPSQAVGLC